MPLFGRSLEYGIHSLLMLVDVPASVRLSVADLAEFQGLPTPYLAKIFTKLQKAGIVRAAEGVFGGFVLARSAEDISVLDVARALEPHKRVFECADIRANCVLFDGSAPTWATRGRCNVHAVMLQAERALHDSLARQSLRSLATATAAKIPVKTQTAALRWFDNRQSARRPVAKSEKVL